MHYNPFNPPVLTVPQDRIQAPRSWRIRQEGIIDYESVYEYESSLSIIHDVFKKTTEELFIEIIVKKYIYARNHDKKIKLGHSTIFDTLDIEISNLNQLFSTFKNPLSNLESELLTNYEEFILSEWLNLIPENCFLVEVVLPYIKIRNNLSTSETDSICLTENNFIIVSENLKNLFSKVSKLDKW